MKRTLLIEIGTEELPPKALQKLSQAFAAGVDKALDGAYFEHAEITPYASPRRLALSIADVVDRQADRIEQRRGPALKASFDANGEPTKAALGFARSCGVEVAALGRVSSGDGEWLAFEQAVAGRALGEMIAAIVEQALATLPIPKRMRWGSGESEFVRPVHWVVLLYGDAVIDAQVLGLQAGHRSRGHRFHHGGWLDIANAEEYADTLATSGHVLASFEARRARILELLAAQRDTIGGEAIIDPALLDEVTALVEWPAVICGDFDPHFLELPEEVLIASMQDHQKYFPVRAADGRLANRFVTIANLDSTQPELVRAGNERVIRPRLSDADFFYRSDRAIRLEQRVAGLADMLFEKRLGSLLDKTRRVELIARSIAPACGADRDEACRAAHLSRSDLLSLMVGEFPELQGTMGAYYASADGEAAAVSAALGEFYHPRFAGDDIPATPSGRTIALADKLDSLVGIFGIGSAPTGDKDPYALRRAALGVLRILIEGGIELDLVEVIAAVRAAYGEIALAPDTTAQVYAFMRERLRGYLLERGIPADVCAAVLANNPSSPREITRRIDAVVSFRAMDAAAALAAANKRIANILRKLDTPPAPDWSRESMADAAEIALADRLAALDGELDTLFANGDYTAYLARLAGLRESIDNFFDTVMVMSEDAGQRRNRLALLAQLHERFTRVADIAELQGS